MSFCASVAIRLAMVYTAAKTLAPYLAMAACKLLGGLIHLISRA
jgi:hypothetical protein